MKCRILKKGTVYIAQVEETYTVKGGRFSRTGRRWKTINHESHDQIQGTIVHDYFPTIDSAEYALRNYASEQEPTVVKEFEA